MLLKEDECLESIYEFHSGFKTNWQPLEFHWLLDNISLVTLVKVITFLPLMNFLQSPTFAESDAHFNTFLNLSFEIKSSSLIGQSKE